MAGTLLHFFRKGEDHSSVIIKPGFGIGPVGFDRLAKKLFGIQVASPLKSFFAETDHARTILAVLISGFRLFNVSGFRSGCGCIDF